MTLETFGDTVSLWLVNRASAEDVVRAACDLLVTDGPTADVDAAVLAEARRVSSTGVRAWVRDAPRRRG